MRRLGAALAMAALLAGCGGGDDDKTLSAKEYRQQADSACGRMVDARERLTPAQDIEGLKAYANSVIAIGLEGLKDLRGLEPPDELADAHKDLTNALASAVKLQQQAVDTDQADSAAVDRINGLAGKAHVALVKAAASAKLPRCQAL